MARFRLLRGVHILKTIKNGEKIRKRLKRGAEFETEDDMLLHNSSGSIKFEKLSDAGRSSVFDEDEDEEAVDLSKMTKAQLQSYAAKHEIEYASDDTKADLLARIEDAQASEDEDA